MIGLLETGLSNALMATVLALVAAVLCRLYPRPAFAHGLWLLVLLKLVAPPLVFVPFPWFAGQEPAELAPPELAVPPEEAPEPDAIPGLADLEIEPLDLALAEPQAPAVAGFLPASLVQPVLILWLGGAVLCFVCIAWSTWRFQRLLRFAGEADEAIQDQVTDLARKLGIAHPLRVWLVPGAVSPMLWTLNRRPRLLFPADLVARLNPDQLKTLLMHELAHWRRRDHWVRFLEVTVQVLYWWHPAVWWARRALHEAEEQCCDAWVVTALDGADRTYALALLETVAFISHTRLKLPATASGIGQVPHLRRRLTMIMNRQTPRSLTWAGGILLAGFGLALLPLVPVRAQESPDKPIRFRVVQAGQPEQKKASLDQEIEALRQVLQALEAQREQRRTEVKPAPAINPEEVKKAHDEVERLARIVAAKRQDLARAERALQQAKAKLAKAQGQPHSVTLRWVADKDVLKWDVRELKLSDVGNVRVQTVPMQIQVHAAKKMVRSVPEDLSQRLDRLLREVEQLRQEVRRKQPENLRGR